MKQNSFLLDIILTILSCGLWNIWVQYRQMKDINMILQKKTYRFSLTILFTICTLGLYFWYHEYRLTKELHELNGLYDLKLIEIFVPLLTFFGLWFLVDSYQQDLLNTKIANDQGVKKTEL